LEAAIGAHEMNDWQNNTMMDATGALVPMRFVPVIVRERDRMVRRLTKEAKRLNAALVAHKANCLAEIARFQDHAAAAYGVKLGGEKDGIVLSSFDGKLKIERRNCTTLAFDERLVAAQTLINQWLEDKTVGLDHDLLEMINKAFRGRNKNLRFGEVVRLTTLNIKGAKWEQAMNLIRASITVQSSKTHCRFYERDGINSEYKMIALDIAKV